MFILLMVYCIGFTVNLVWMLIDSYVVEHAKSKLDAYLVSVFISLVWFIFPMYAIVSFAFNLGKLCTECIKNLVKTISKN